MGNKGHLRRESKPQVMHPYCLDPHHQQGKENADKVEMNEGWAKRNPKYGIEV